MRATHRRSTGWGAEALCALLVVFLAPRVSSAAVSGSKHDFSGISSISSGAGVCGPCHRIHNAPDNRAIWKRDLADEGVTFKQNADPNYIPTPTLLCYDCHDDMTTGTNIDPPSSTWFPGYEPQDIAFSFTAADSTRWKTTIGYYELYDGTLPPGGIGGGPVDGTPTGGHYWKDDPGGTADPGKRGDKISCAFCHDPHKAKTGSNDVFFLTTTTNYDGGTVNLQKYNSLGHKASKLTRSGALGTGDGRSMCAECHTYSSPSDPATPPTIAGVPLTKPPSYIPQHDQNHSTACVKCHAHNKINASCNECHGYPPMVASAFNRTTNPNGQSYAGVTGRDGAGAHQRHKDALGSAIFACEICHGPDPGAADWHNTGNGVVSQINIDIIGKKTFWDPTSTRPGPFYPDGNAGIVNPDPTNYEFTAKGKNLGDQRCANLACHGDPPDAVGALQWTDDMVDDTSALGPAVDIAICKWCHDSTPSTIDGGTTYAPNVMGDNNGAGSTWTTGNFGADVNGHGLASGNYEGDLVGEVSRTGQPRADKICTKCHDARYQTNAPPTANDPIKWHYRINQDVRLFDSINNQGGIADSPDNTCPACHQVAAGGPERANNTQISTHGNVFADKKEADFTRACSRCHNVHGSNWNGLVANGGTNGRNLHMIGSWVDANGNGVGDGTEGARVDTNNDNVISGADNAVVFVSRTGANSFDENDGPYNAANDVDDICATCHNDQTRGGDHSGTAGPFEQRGNNCMQCHDHDYDNNIATADAFMPSGCNGCHGTNPTEALQPNAIRGQYWPDGAAVIPAYNYADDQPGAHLNHVTALAGQVFGETAAQLVADYTAQNPTMVSRDKQIAVCSFCHKDPGGANHSSNDGTVPSGASRADVYRGGSATNYFQKFTTGTHPTYLRTNYTDDVTALDSTYNYGTESCANLVCHNQWPTPVSPTGWNAPPVWILAIVPTCANTTCHATGTAPAGTYTISHTAHVSSTRKNYECFQCHVNNNSPSPNLAHGNGKVEMAWNIAGGIEAGIGAANGFYDKDDAGGNNNTKQATDDTFAYKDGNYVKDCRSVYCHGGDNAAWGGGSISPVWSNTATTYCGSCHDGNGTGAPSGDGSVTATGNHTDHLTAAYGPVFGTTGCVGTATTGCHTSFDTPTYTPTHVDGSIQFANIVTTAAPYSTLGTTAPAGAPLSNNTDRCNYCHSTASVTVNIPGPSTITGVGTTLVKDQTNWDNTAYQVPCLTCHNGLDSAWRYAGGSGLRAKNMLGDDSNYGAEVRGHSRSSLVGPPFGQYPVSTNPVANQECTGCHDATVTHLNTVDDTSYSGNRMLGTIMGVVGLTTPTGACRACHDNTASTATRKNVDMHTNTDYPLPTAITQGRLEAMFAGPECMQCHEPHGMTANSAGTAGLSNIYMVPATITVVSGTQFTNVRFEGLTGNYSYNDTQGTPTDDICTVCHVSNANPGYPMNNPGGDGQHGNIVPASTFYDGDERGHNCTGCHPHNRDNDTTTTNDGFMPVACNACHTYPGLANLGAPTHLNSATHNIHAGDPVAGTINNYAFRCRTCHSQNDHNQTGMNVGDAWSIANGNVNIRFDPTRNGNALGNPTYAGANAFTGTAPGVGGTGVCANLYCHGNGTNGTNGGNLQFPSDFQGSDITPQWSDAASANCGTCHEIASSTPPIGTLAHPKHVGPVASGQYAIGCQVCHYGTTTNGTTVPAASMPVHVNGSVEVSFNAAADIRVDGSSGYSGDTAIGSGYGSCSATYCHSNGTDLAAPYDTAGSAAPANPVLLWSQTPGTCWNCHGAGTNSMPAYTDGSPKANKHVIHNATNGFGCQLCHYTVTTSGTAIAGVSLHVNRAYNVAEDSSGPTLYRFTWSAPNCNATACHGGNSAVTWSGTTIACNTCHSSVGGAVTNTDVNDFAWAGGTPTMSKISYAQYTADSGGHGSNVPRTIGLACNASSCHDSTVGHDITPNLSGANPFRLVDQSGVGGLQFGCDYTGAGCHEVGITGPQTGVDISTFTTHTRAAMSAAGYTTKRTWPSWDPQCINCHDPHGDASNISMIQKELYDKAAFPVTGVPPAAPTEQTNLVFTDSTTGADSAGNSYADLDSAYSSICQECHEDSSVQSFHDGAAGGTASMSNHPGTGVNPGDCSNCHSHAGGFAPTECEGCHGGDPASFAPYATHPGRDGSQGTGDEAPNSISAQISSTWYSVWDGSWWDASQGSSSAQRGGHGDAGGSPAVKCKDCHDISSPQPSTHFDGTVNTFDYPGKSSTINSNTSHLKSFFFAGASPPVATAQTTFDDACGNRAGCHQGSVTNHRHTTGWPGPSDNIMLFGQSLTSGESSTSNPKQTRTGTLWVNYWTPWVMKDLQSTVTGTAYHGVCVSCHDPHGTTATDKPPTNDSGLSNSMIRYNSLPPARPQSGPTFFCTSNCHKDPPP